jgi:hypothetical protein
VRVGWSRRYGLILGALALIPCALGASATRSWAKREDETIAPPAERAIIAARARAVVGALARRDMAALSSLVHPDRGVRFSNYGQVAPGDLVLRASELEKALLDSRKRVRTAYDGADEGVSMTFRVYYDRFVYDRDFASVRKVSTGSAISTAPDAGRRNFREAYRTEELVEFYLPPGAKNWERLILAFEKCREEWVLVGIIHDEWTI